MNKELMENSPLIINDQPILPKLVVVIVVEVTAPLPWDGGTAQPKIQAHAVNLIELG